jgi:hypothetical protein
LKLNGAYRLLVCVDNVNTLGGSVHNIKKKVDVFVFATKENGIEVNANKAK